MGVGIGVSAGIGISAGAGTNVVNWYSLVIDCPDAIVIVSIISG